MIYRSSELWALLLRVLAWNHCRWVEHYSRNYNSSVLRVCGHLWFACNFSTSQILASAQEFWYVCVNADFLSLYATTYPSIQLVLWFQGRSSPTGGCKNKLNLIHLWLIRGKIMLYLGNNVSSLPVANRCYEILTSRFCNTEIQDKCFKLHSFWIHFELLIQRAHPNIN